MPGTLKVGGNIIASHSGVEGAGTVTLGNVVLGDSAVPSNLSIINRRYKKDGLTQANYARTAEDILEHYPNSSDGYYWICPLQDNLPFQIYCDMTNGGWMRIKCVTDVSNDTSKRNIYYSNANSNGYWHTSGMGGTNTYLPSNTDAGYGFRTSGYFGNEGFYTPGGNNSYNTPMVHFFDHTRVLGTPYNPCSYADWKVNTFLGYSWGWSSFYVSQFPKHQYFDTVNNYLVKNTRTYIGIMNNNSNNNWGVQIQDDNTDLSSAWTTGLGFGNYSSIIKEGVNVQGWRNAIYTGTPTHTATLSQNFYGILVNGFQSPSCVEFINIEVKNLYTGEI